MPGSDTEELICVGQDESLRDPHIPINSGSSDVVIVEETRNGRKKMSNEGSLMHLIKGNVGTGILAMPTAIKNAGLWTGVVGLVLIAIVAVHCMHMLVRFAELLCNEGEEETILDYGQVTEEAFKRGPAGTRRFAKAARKAVNVFICITQFGFCTVYVLFVAQNMQQFVEYFAPWSLCVQFYELIVLALLIPYSLIKTLKTLKHFSTFANVLSIISLLVLLVYCARNMQPIHKYPAFNSWSTLPMFFGIAIYAFEGIAVVLPVRNEMKDQAAISGLNGVLNTAMVIVTVMYLAVGFYGYLAFGDQVLGSVTLNLPDEPLYLGVRLTYAVAIYFSYGLQFYVPTEFFPAIVKRCLPAKYEDEEDSADLVKEIQTCTPRWSPWMADNLLRISCVVFTFLLASVIPHLDLMISLIGALASSALALIIPPMLDLLTRSDAGWLRKVKNIAIMVFGILGFVLGTIVTVINIVEALHSGGSEGLCQAYNSTRT